MAGKNRWSGWEHGKTRGRRRLPGSIADDLGIAIVRGRYRPGHIFSGEIEASTKLGVSRSAYREAMRILVAKGMVSSRPKTGTKVNPQGMWHLLDPEVLGWAFRHEPDTALVANLFELRMTIEPAAADLAARRRTLSHLATMEQALVGMERLGLAAEEGRKADCLFHETLLEATGNAFFVSLSAGMAAAIHWTTVYKTRASPLPRDPMPAHQRVFAAIRAEDPTGARQATADLVQMAFEDTRSVVPVVRPPVRAARKR